MLILKPEIKEITFHTPNNYTAETWLEAVGRTCYMSADKTKENSSSRFIKMLLDRKHLSIFEHIVVSCRIVADRGFTHELVRHRISSYAQESSRYCNYSKGKFNNEISIIEYPWKKKNSYNKVKNVLELVEQLYMELLEDGETPELARAILPISLKSEIVITTNLREWMNIFDLRTGSSAHPIIREIMIKILNEFERKLPSIFTKNL